MRKTTKTIIKWSLILGGFCLITSFSLNPQREQVLGVPNFTKEYVEVTNTPTAPANEASTDKKPASSLAEVIVLTEKNSLTFRGPVTASSVSAFQQDAFKKSLSLSKHDVIYLVIDSPGGSVIDGNMLIDSLKALPQKVKTISLFSASMAFQMVQNMEERLITPSGTLMSHRASGGFEGEFGGDGKGELITRLNWVLEILRAADVNAASRMGMSVKDYQELIRDEYWANGSKAVEDKAADRLVLVRCDANLLSKEETLEVRSFFGIALLTFSKCPLLTYPLNIEMSFEESVNEDSKAEFKLFVNKLVKDKRNFVKDYIVNNRINRIVK